MVAWTWPGTSGSGTRSLYRDYPYDPADGREEAPEFASFVLRGGAYSYDASHVRCAARLSHSQMYRDGNIGFRVVLLPFSSDL
jgi:formylglycine-generating enzyme required for sulfatase activity